MEKPLDFSEDKIPLLDRMTKTLDKKICYVCAQRETVYTTPSKIPVCVGCVARIDRD